MPMSTYMQAHASKCAKKNLQECVKSHSEQAQQKHDNVDSIHSSQNQCKIMRKTGHSTRKCQTHAQLIVKKKSVTEQPSHENADSIHSS